MPQPFPTRISVVAGEVLTYHRKMKELAEYLSKDPKLPVHLRIDPAREYLQFFIDRESFKNLVAMWDLPGTNSIAVYFGLANPEQDGSAHGVTGCFVAVNADRNVVDGHFPATLKAEPLLKPEDTWIPPGGGGARVAAAREFTLSTPLDEVAQHFTR